MSKRARSASPDAPAVPGDDAECAARTVYCEGLAYECSEEEVRGFFEACGPVVSLRLPRYQDSGRLRGYAHVELGTAAAAAAAVARSGAVLRGRYVAVARAAPRRGRRGPRRAAAAAARGLPHGLRAEPALRRGRGRRPPRVRALRRRRRRPPRGLEPHAAAQGLRLRPVRQGGRRRGRRPRPAGRRGRRPGGGLRLRRPRRAPGVLPRGRRRALGEDQGRAAREEGADGAVSPRPRGAHASARARPSVAGRARTYPAGRICETPLQVRLRPQTSHFNRDLNTAARPSKGASTPPLTPCGGPPARRPRLRGRDPPKTSGLRTTTATRRERIYA